MLDSTVQRETWLTYIYNYCGIQSRNPCVDIHAVFALTPAASRIA
jgi:hypothetical protein